MEKQQERILIIESDPKIVDFLVRQTLQPLGFLTEVASNAGNAFQSIENFRPDLIICDLCLPQLSAKDVLAALNGQGSETPLVVISKEVEEGDILDAFRMGAVDFILMPARETEVFRVVERALKQVRLKKQIDELNSQLHSFDKQSSAFLKVLSNLKVIQDGMQSLTALPDILQLFLQQSVQIAQADKGLICLRNNPQATLYLAAMHAMPEELNASLYKEWEDGLSTHWEAYEPIQIVGEPLKPFILSRYGQAALILPIHYQTILVGVCILLKEQPLAFEEPALRFASIYCALLALILLYAIQQNETTTDNRISPAEKVFQTGKKEVLIRNNILKAYETTLAMLSEEGIALNNKQRKMLYQINDALQAILTEISPLLFQSDENSS